MHIAKVRASGTQSIRRATLLIKAIAAHNRVGVRLVDLTEALPLDRTTMHRIMKALVDEKLVTKDQASRRYFLGPTLFELGLSAGHRYDLRNICDPILEGIAQKTGDTVFLNVRSGNDVVCVDRKNGPYPVKVFTLDVGDRRPLGISASGVAIMSALPADEIKSIVNKLDPEVIGYKKTQIPAKAVLRAVMKAQKEGYALHQGILKDVRAIAVPVRRAGVPFAAIGVTAISSRMKEERHREIVQLLKEGTRELEQLLSGQDISRPPS